MSPIVDLYKQTVTLRNKTLKIIISRHFTSTLYSALILPVIASVYLGLGQQFNKPNNKFGIGDPRDILSLGDALSDAGSRDTVVFVNSDHTGGAIDNVIDSLADVVTNAGKNATRLSKDSDIGYVCKSSATGTSSCFGAVVFHSSPEEGDDGYWNYTLRGDAALGRSFNIEDKDNDAQVYALPLQHAVDSTIAKLNSSVSFPDKTLQYGFSALTEDERADKVRRDYQQSFINYLSVAFIIALIGVCYHMPGFIASEREAGLAQLIDAMMPTSAPWHRQVARLFSHHNAFIITYFPGWIIASIVCRVTIWKNASFGIMIPFFVLSGMALTSMSLVGACLFKKAQLSGIITALVWLVLGIVAQVIPHPNAAAVAVLSLLFTPCNFVFFITYIARYEQEGQATNLLHAYESSPWKLPGLLLWVFLAIQILLYPFIAAFIERALHGVTTGVRSNKHAKSNGSEWQDAVKIENMTKIYRPSFLRRLFSFVSPPRPEVVAVDSLSLTAKKGQILALLGANGSGKSTTLDAIAGISNFTSGDLSIDTSGGLGIAPQKNVLWDELTVQEHIDIFNRLKSPGKLASKEETEALIDAIGLKAKTHAWSKTLSGGQKRKLQLGIMLTGGSAVCCVDEVSSGIDPLSRRKIWDILLSERGSRTIIMTTHFLDEADLLADNIVILSKGKLRAEGSSVQLKNTYGAGYRVSVLNARQALDHVPEIDGVERNISTNAITYVAPSSNLAADVIRALEAQNIPYRFSGPTIEDVFLNLADEVKEHDMEAAQQAPLHEGAKKLSQASESPSNEKLAGAAPPALLQGHRIGIPKQTLVFLRKRWTILKTNWIPYLAAFLIPIVAAAVIQLLIRNQDPVGCAPVERNSEASNDDFTDLLDGIFIVGGPSSGLSKSAASNLFKANVPGAIGADGGGTGSGNFTLKITDTFDAFKNTVEDDRKNVTPAGLWLGQSSSPPTLAFKIDDISMYSAVLGQNLLNSLLAETTLATSYRPFDFAAAPSTSDGLQVIVYFLLACSIIPGLLALYPNSERRNSVRALQYSSGARALPVWAAHILFDWSIVLVAMLIAAGILVGSSNIWYHGEYLIPVFMFYALASILISYFVSLFAGTSLATYAISAVIQSLGFAIYLIAFLFILTFSDAVNVNRDILIGHWVISLFFPTGSLVRAMMVGQNVFSSTCDGFELRSYPGAMAAYGGPILYLIVQSAFWFAMVVWFDSSDGKYQSGSPKMTPEVNDPEIAAELDRVEGADNTGEGLRVVHLTKAFKKFTAVDNVTFGVEHGEVFALLGPNGAGKSTTISLIRGDIAPSRRGGDVFVENASITKNRPGARANLGVCPQFDAIDSMTVREHLEHYARIRGIEDVPHQVQAVISAVGLERYVNVMAHTLSGGNKRKLSLAIALTGNPSVILLDEPSSGLDAAAKRIMWRTLETIVPGRSILLTTHSMEEADTLANRAGIMAKRMLALGNTEQLCQRFGDTLHVHLVSKTAPHSTDEEMNHIHDWVVNNYPGAEVEQETFHGQMKFSIPASSVPTRGTADKGSAIGQLLVTLEENKDQLGIAHHSVTPTTLNQVFLTIVGQHNVQEEGETTTKTPWWKKFLWGMK